MLRNLILANVIVSAGFFIFCSPSLPPLDMNPPFPLPTPRNVTVSGNDSGVVVEFENPWYQNQVPAGIDTPALHFAVTEQNSQDSSTRFFPVHRYIVDSVVKIFCREMGISGFFSGGISYYSVALTYGYYSGESSPPVGFLNEASSFARFKNQYAGSSWTNYTVSVYNCVPGARTDEMSQETKAFFQTVSSGILHLEIVLQDTVFSEPITSSLVSSLLYKVKKDSTISDVCFILPRAAVATLYGKDSPTPLGFANGSYFVLNQVASTFVFIHELLHNVRASAFHDLYNGYSAVQYPYVNSLAGSIFGDENTLYIPRLFRAGCGWEPFNPVWLHAGSDTTVIVLATDAGRNRNAIFWLGVDEYGFSRAISLELISDKTAYHGWQGPGLRVYEFFDKAMLQPGFVHLFPLSEKGENAPVSETVFCLGGPAWRDTYGRTPLWYSEATQRGLSIKVVKEYGSFDSMDVKISYSR